MILPRLSSGRPVCCESGIGLRSPGLVAVTTADVGAAVKTRSPWRARKIDTLIARYLFYMRIVGAD
jgi:hypothetical protein